MGLHQVVELLEVAKTLNNSSEINRNMLITMLEMQYYMNVIKSFIVIV